MATIAQKRVIPEGFQELPFGKGITLSDQRNRIQVVVQNTIQDSRENPPPLVALKGNTFCLRQVDGTYIRRELLQGNCYQAEVTGEVEQEHFSSPNVIISGLDPDANEEEKKGYEKFSEAVKNWINTQVTRSYPKGLIKYNVTLTRMEGC